MLKALTNLRERKPKSLLWGFEVSLKTYCRDRNGKSTKDMLLSYFGNTFLSTARLMTTIPLKQQ